MIRTDRWPVGEANGVEVNLSHAAGLIPIDRSFAMLSNVGSKVGPGGVARGSASRKLGPAS